MMKKSQVLFLMALLGLSVACGGGEKLKKAEADLAACKEGNTKLQADLDAAKEAAAGSGEAAESYRKLLAERAALAAELETKLKSLLDAGTLTITYRRGLMVLQLPNGILFDSGKTQIKPEGVRAIKLIGNALAKVTNRRMIVSGHTDNVAISKKNKEFKSNWQLSSARAQVVLDQLTKHGVVPKQLIVAGFGEFDSLKANNTEENRTLNRRTEIILLPNLDSVLGKPATRTAQR